MNRFFRFLAFSLLVTSMLSCSAQTDDLAASSQTIRFSADGDQFLKNFVVPEPGGLSIGLSYEEALFAGASKAGYAELESQIEQINKEYDAKSYKYWTDAIQQQHVATKSTAMNVSREGCDKYYVLPQDRFLGNFLYCEDEKVVLKISEEKAVLCGATVEGYRILRDETIAPNNIWDKIVQEGQATYEKIRESFDSNREFILRYGNCF